VQHASRWLTMSPNGLFLPGGKPLSPANSMLQRSPMQLQRSISQVQRQQIRQRLSSPLLAGLSSYPPPAVHTRSILQR
jgi:hypothetical protein